jgi:hypothetical protein
VSYEVIPVDEVEGGDEPSDSIPSASVEILVIRDEQGPVVNLSYVADTGPADLIESALNLIQQVTMAALNNPTSMRAGQLRLGDDTPW